MQVLPNPTSSIATAYYPRSWIHPATFVASSPIAGQGLFARAGFRAGDVVVIWGGAVFSEAERQAGVARERSLAVIDEGAYLGSFVYEPETADEFMNHACNPNVWLQNATTLVTMRDIEPGEELTIDYALWETDAAWAMQCCCGAVACRQWITGQDWMQPALQTRYAGHFSPYVQRRIRKLAGTASSDSLARHIGQV